MTPCAATDCPKASRSRGYCMSHYHAVRRIGVPILVGKGRPPIDPLVRLAAMYEVQPNGCWAWQGHLSDQGYGMFHGGKALGRNQAHRQAYVLLVGPIPAGMHLDHVCHTEDESCPGGQACQHRRCVNPAHLEPVTPAENVRRARMQRAA